MILYHGTSARHLSVIRRQGLLPRRLTGNSNWNGDVESKDSMVYLTDAYPVYFALVAAFAEGKEPADLLILQVEVDESELYPDEDFIAWALASDRSDVQQTTLNPFINPADYKDAWRWSLETNGVVCTPSVPADRILDHRTIPPTETEIIAELGLDPLPTPLNYRQFAGHYRRCLDALFTAGLEAALIEIQQHGAA